VDNLIASFPLPIRITNLAIQHQKTRDTFFLCRFFSVAGSK